jgi:hypothetical protein
VRRCFAIDRDSPTALRHLRAGTDLHLHGCICMAASVSVRLYLHMCRHLYQSLSLSLSLPMDGTAHSVLTRVEVTRFFDGFHSESSMVPSLSE